MTGNRGVSILCTGDIHLGRHPGRVDSGAKSLSPTAVWERIVDEAINRDVDALALTGDVIDRDNRYYEARGPLERGVMRLGEAGIPTFAVAGNHDYDVLPDLVSDIGGEYFHLLGAGGHWEHRTIESEEGEPVHLVGWSYPAQHVQTSPLDSLELPTQRGTTIGLLHTELDKPGSPYAPVRSADLAGSSVDAWLLGHIHRPHQPDCGTGLVLYPGSPQPLDPGEPGEHGAWLVQLGAGSARCRQLPLATLRYRELTVNLEGVDDESGFRRKITGGLREDLDDTAEAPGELERVVYRLRLTGRTTLHRRIDQLGAPLVDDLNLSAGGVDADVDRVIRNTVPPIDLERLAGGNDPPGVLARCLLEVQQGQDHELSRDCRGLFETIRTRIEEVHHSNAYKPLVDDEQPGEEWMRDQIIREGMALLDEMLSSDRS